MVRRRELRRRRDDDESRMRMLLLGRSRRRVRGLDCVLRESAGFVKLQMAHDLLDFARRKSKRTLVRWWMPSGRMSRMRAGGFPSATAGATAMPPACSTIIAIGFASYHEPQLPLRILSRGRIQKGAPLDQRPVHVGDHRADVAAGVPLAVRPNPGPAGCRPGTCSVRLVHQ